MKKIISVFLAVLLLGALAAPAFAVPAAYDETSPIIYVIGRTTIYNNLHTDRQAVPDAGNDEIMAAVQEALPYAAKAVLLGQWNEYADMAYDLFMSFFEGYGLDENGEVYNDSGVTWSWSENNLSRDYTSNNPYTYKFEYDARLSPLEIADDLNDYIEAVKRVTGKEKVSIIARCLGANIALAYLYKYQESEGYSGIDTLVLYDASSNGIEILETAMSGSIKVDSAAASKFLRDFDLNVDNETIAAILPMTLQMLEETYGMEFVGEFIEGFYDHVKDSLFRRFLLSTFASTPGYWSMVNDNYDEAMQYIFGKEDAAEKYSVLIGKIEDYRNNVQLHTVDMLEDMREAGVDIAAIVKYGAVGYPIFEDADKLTDGVTGVVKQSFGATVSDFDATLGTSYIKARTAAGYGAYISPDGQIDASTGLFADTTWFIKNYAHNPFYDSINPLLNAICRNKGFNVNSDENWPQFTVMEDGGNHNVARMTEENCDPTNSIVRDGDTARWKDPFLSIIKFFKFIIDLVRTLFNR